MELIKSFGKVFGIFFENFGNFRSQWAIKIKCWFFTITYCAKMFNVMEKFLSSFNCKSRDHQYSVLDDSLINNPCQFLFALSGILMSSTTVSCLANYISSI